jgi:hypothetical protein
MVDAKTKISENTSDVHEEAKQLAALLEKAMEQPGVKEVMQVFGEWSKTNEAITIYQSYQDPYPPNTLSSSSNPA